MRRRKGWKAWPDERSERRDEISNCSTSRLARRREGTYSHRNGVPRIVSPGIGSDGDPTVGSLSRSLASARSVDERFERNLLDDSVRRASVLIRRVGRGLALDPMVFTEVLRERWG